MEKVQEYKEKIDGAFNRFKKFIADNKDDKRKVFDKFEEFYNWLLCKFNDETDDECSIMIESQIWKLIGLAVRWSEISGVRLKECSDGWNSKMVSSVMYFCDDYKKDKKKFNATKDGIIKFGGVVSRIFKEKDFATKMYCFMLLHQRGVVSNYEAIGVPNKKIDNDEPKEPVPEKEYQYQGDGEHYGEMMTYSQCKEMKLKTNLLWDLENHYWSNEWFEEKEKKEKEENSYITEDVFDELGYIIFNN